MDACTAEYMGVKLKGAALRCCVKKIAMCKKDNWTRAALKSVLSTLSVSRVLYVSYTWRRFRRLQRHSPCAQPCTSIPSYVGRGLWEYDKWEEKYSTCPPSAAVLGCGAPLPARRDANRPPAVCGITSVSPSLSTTCMHARVKNRVRKLIVERSGCIVAPIQSLTGVIRSARRVRSGLYDQGIYC